MRFVEADLWGIYVAPISIMMIAAYALLFCFRKVATRLGWFNLIWHPALFEFAVYMIILSTIVLITASLHPHA